MEITTTSIITIINSIGLFALGFVPTLAVLELSWKMAYRLGKRDMAGAGATKTQHHNSGKQKGEGITAA